MNAGSKDKMKHDTGREWKNVFIVKKIVLDP